MLFVRHRFRKQSLSRSRFIYQHNINSGFIWNTFHPFNIILHLHWNIIISSTCFEIYIYFSYFMNTSNISCHFFRPIFEPSRAKTPQTFFARGSLVRNFPFSFLPGFIGRKRDIRLANCVFLKSFKLTTAIHVFRMSFGLS